MKFLLSTLCALFISSSALAGVGSFEFPLMSGGERNVTYKSSDFPNAVFVLEVWGYSCPYCHQNAVNVADLYNEYADNDNVQVVDVGLDRDSSSYSRWIARHNPPQPVVQDSSRQVYNSIGGGGIPAVVVTDCNGEVLYSHNGTWDSRTKRTIRDIIESQLESGCTPAK